jgi:hypothetical protein
MLPTPEHSEQIRASDADRDRYVAALRTQCADGRLTLDEFSDRVERIYAAQIRTELDDVIADLAVPWHSPVRTHATVATVREKVRRRRWHVAVFGETARRGKYRLTGDTAAVAIFGECTLDLSQAEWVDPEMTIDAVALFGQVTVIVPAGVDVALEGVAIFGEKRLSGDDQSTPGSPMLLVRAVATFGEVRVRRSDGRSASRHRGGRGE